MFGEGFQSTNVGDASESEFEKRMRLKSSGNPELPARITLFKSNTHHLAAARAATVVVMTALRRKRRKKPAFGIAFFSAFG